MDNMTADTMACGKHVEEATKMVERMLAGEVNPEALKNLHDTLSLARFCCQRMVEERKKGLPKLSDVMGAVPMPAPEEAYED